MYTLDTNTLIYYLDNDPKAIRLLEDFAARGILMYVSVITVVELFSRPNIAQAEKDLIEGLLESFVIVPVDMQLARIAGSLRSRRKMKTPDSVIAATAIFTETTLVTRNMADFETVELLKVLKV